MVNYQMKERASFLDLTDRVSIITGASRGIGAAAAIELAKLGSKVALLDLSLDDAKSRADEIAREHGVKAQGYALDIRDRAKLYETITEIAREFGAIDHLINNAGVQHVSPLESFPDDKWDFVRSIDLDGVFFAIKAVWPHMIARGRGRIVNIASVQGLVGSPFKIAYNAAKHGVVGLTKTAAIEGATLNITVNAVCPGAVLTELIKGQAKDLQRSYGGGITEEQALERAFLDAMPTKRFIDPEEVGQLCAFLCSEAARSITGAPIPIDGGWVAH